MSVTSGAMTAAELAAFLTNSVEYETLAQAIAQGGFYIVEGGEAIAGAMTVTGGAGQAVVSAVGSALDVATPAISASGTTVKTATVGLLKTATGLKTAGIAKVSISGVAAMAAPFAGVALGTGLYASNPKLWTDLSKKLLPFCYPGTTSIPTWIDIGVDAVTGSYIYKALVALGVIEAVTETLNEAGVKPTNGYANLNGAIVNYTSAITPYKGANNSMHYAPAALLVGNNAYIDSTAYPVTGGRIYYTAIDANGNEFETWVNVRYYGYKYVSTAYPGQVGPETAFNQEDVAHILSEGTICPGTNWAPGTSQWRGDTLAPPTTVPVPPIIVVPDPVGPDYQPLPEPVPATPLTPLPLPAPPAVPLLPPEEPTPLLPPYKEPEEWPEEEPWPETIPFPWEPTIPNPEREPWPEHIPWPLPPERPEEWPKIPTHWPFELPDNFPKEFPDKKTWPSTPEEWPTEVPWPEPEVEEKPSDWPEELPWPWPDSPEDWPEEVPWPVPWPEEWPAEDPWPIKWPDELPYPDPLPYPSPTPDPEQVPDPTKVGDPDTEIDPYIDPWPWPYPDPTKTTDPNPTKDPTNPDPKIDDITYPLPEPYPYPKPDPETQPDPADPTPPPPPTGTITEPPVPYVPLPFTANTGIISVYHPSQSELISFANWLWVTWQDATIEKIWNNPFDGVITLFELYCTPTDVGSKSIKSGFLDSGIVVPIISRYTEIDCGSIGVPEYYGNYFDYAPYTKAYIYLPFIGVVELNSDDIVGHGVNVTYRIDEYNGSCIAMITVAKSTEVNGDSVSYSNIFYQFSGNCAVELPIAGGSQAAIKAGMIEAAAWGLGSVIGGVLGGNSVGSIAQGMAYGAASAVHSVVSAKSSVQHSGSFGSSYGAMGVKKPFITIVRPKQIQVNNYNELYGYQAHKAVNIGSCTGYLRCREVHVISSTASDEEKTQIEQLLKSGVYVTE